MKLFVALLPAAILLCLPGCSDSNSPEEEAYMRLGEGTHPVWMPDNSAVSAVGLFENLGRASQDGPEYLLFYSPTGSKLIDKKKVGETTALIQSYAWSHTEVDPSIVYTIYDYSSRTYKLLRRDDLDADPVVLFESDQPISSPSWTWDNSKIVFYHPGTYSQAYQVDASGGQPTELNNDLGWGEALQLNHIHCAGDGPYLVYATKYVGQAPNIYSIDLAGGEPTKLTDFDDSEIYIRCTALSPDGVTLAYITGNTGTRYQFVYLQAMSGGEPKKVIETAFDTFPPFVRMSSSFSWSPDGDRIVVGTSLYDGVDYDFSIYMVPLDEYLD
ncbi:TolB family protein [candidate division KSB1 bacterium]